MKVLLVVVLFLVTVCTAAAQATNTHVSEEMKALNFLVGKWQGKVIYEPDSDHPQEVPWTLHVYYTVGGNILLVDEKGSEIENRNNTTREVIVVIYWDSAAKVYPTRLYFPRKGGAGSAEAKGLVRDNKLEVLMNLQSAVSRSG